MGINQFQLDIAGLVTNGLQQAGGLSLGTIITQTPSTRDPNNSDRMIPGAETTHSAQMVRRERRYFNQQTQQLEIAVRFNILINTISPVIPDVTAITKIRYDGDEFTIVQQARDPVNATIRCFAKR